MIVTKPIQCAKKVIRCVKCRPIHIIKWQLKDNLCLLYALWEMCTTTQKDILTVSCKSR